MMFTATVPGTGATSLQLTASGRVLASMRHPTPGPSVRLILPRGGLKAFHHALPIRWRARGARTATITAAIQYEASPRTGWQTLAGGLTTGSYRVPISMFAHARRVHIRVITNDGFSTATTATGIIKLPRR
jgi:hypothetical protein